MADSKSGTDKPVPTNTEEFGCRDLSPSTPKKSTTDKSEKGDAK